MNRTLKLSVLTALALASSQAWAMDLGQIQVKSALDRPLVAEIPLHPDHPGEADHVKVSLASADAFARAGISRADLKVTLNFKVVTHADGKKFIRVTSTRPVRETYLDFLIQVSWPKGRMLREYTVLLDPLSVGSTPSATASASAGSTRTAKAAPAPTPAPAPAPAPETSSAARSDVYGPVKHGDTLSHIAQSEAIDGVSYQQMLVALKAANPDAFFKDNVNALKTGAVLRIPSRQQALAVTRKAAIAAVRQQNRAWQGAQATAPTMVASSGGSTSPVTSAGAANQGGDHLALVPPEDKGKASAGAAGGGNASAGELRQELARSQEALSSQKQSAADLSSRVQALEQLQKKNQRLLNLKNSEIAELQDKLAAARKAAGLPALPATTAGAGMATAASAQGAMAAAGSTAGAAMPAVSASSAKSAMVTPANVTSTSKPVAAGKAAPAKPRAKTPANKKHTAPATTSAPSRSEASAPWYEQLWARIVLIVIIVLLIIWALVKRRKPGRGAGKPSVAHHFGDSPMGPDDDAVMAAQDAPVDPESIADDDGEHELLAQLAEHPDNVGLHLELASLYYARRDTEQFEASAEAMHAYVDDESQPEWQEVLAMGRELEPDYPLFAAAEPPAVEPHPQVDEPTHEDFESAEHPQDDASDNRFEEDVAPDDAGQAVRSNGYSFDFDLVPESSTRTDRPESLDDEPEMPEVSDEPSHEEQTSGGLPDESEFDALPPLPSASGEPSGQDELHAPEPSFESSAPKPEFDLSEDAMGGDAADDFAREGFSDDPVDTKLDLARAYIDMGDHEGARAMLQEALNEGSQMQKDTARKLIDELD